MTCPSLLCAAFGAFVTNREECKLEAAHRVSVTFEVMGSKRRKFQPVMRPISNPPVHVPLPADKGELAHDALRIVFQLHAGCLGSFAADEWTRLQRAYEIVREYERVSYPLRLHHSRWGEFVYTRRMQIWDQFWMNILDSMVTRIRKLSPTFIPFGAFYGGRVEIRGGNQVVMIAHHVEEAHRIHQSVHPWSFESARAAIALASTKTPIRIVRVRY